MAWPALIAALSKGGGVSLIAPNDNGFALDFTRNRAVIRDQVTPANNYAGSLAGKLSAMGAPGVGVNGARLDASNIHRISATAWPYKATAITISGEIQFDTAVDAAARTIFSVDPGGNDRLQALMLAGSNKPTMTVGLGASAVNVTSATSVTAGTWLRFTGVSGPTGTFIVLNGEVTIDTPSAILAANAAPPAFNGIGTGSGASADAVIASPLLGRMRNMVVLGRAVSKEVAKAGAPFGLSLAAIGDSLTHGIVGGVVDDQALAYPNLLKVRNSKIKNAINAGDQGATTSELWGSRALIIGDGTPDIVIIYAGTNDAGRGTTVEASPSPTSTTFTITSNPAYYPVGCKIFVNGEAATVLSIVGSAITLTAPLAAGAPAAGAAITIDTQKNLEQLITYAKGFTPKVLLAGMHYFNWTSSSGDTTAVEMARNAAIRASQQAAATAAGAVYVDLYAWMRQLILDGTYTQGDWTAWHSSLNNQHLNANGQSILADAFASAIAAQGWA